MDEFKDILPSRLAEIFGDETQQSIADRLFNRQFWPGDCIRDDHHRSDFYEQICDPDQRVQDEDAGEERKVRIRIT